MTTNNFIELDNSSDFGYGQLLQILWRRRLWFLATFCGALAITIPVALSKPPLYQSSMQLLIESNYEDKNNSGNSDLNVTDTNFNIDYATQQKLMSSYLLLEKAVSKLQDDYPELTLEELKAYLGVDQVTDQASQGTIDTKIIQVDYLGEDPYKTQKILKVIERVYQEYNLQQQQVRLQEGLSFIETQLPEARNNLLQAEAALKDFRLKHDLIAPVEEASAVADALREVQAERAEIRAARQGDGGRYQSLQEQLSSPEDIQVSSRLSESSRYQNLLNLIQETEIELKEMRLKFTETHPGIQNLVEKLEEHKTLLKAEVEKILGEVPQQIDLTADALEKEGQLGNIELYISRALGETEASLESMEERDRALAQTEQQLQQELNRFPGLIDQYDSLLQEIEVKRSTLQKLLETKQQLGIEINRGGFNWQLIEPPRVGKQVAPNTTKDLLLGGVIALFGGGIAVFIKEAVDNKVYSTDQLKQHLSLPLLGATPNLTTAERTAFLPRLPFVYSRADSGSILTTLQWQPFRESIDLIYENIQLLNSNSVLNSLVVTSAIAGEGKSTLTLALATSAARRHQKVLIVDANLRNPTLHFELNLSNQNGLSNFLNEATEIPTIEKASILDTTIDILTAGSQIPDPISLLSSSRLNELIKNLESLYDLVIIDTPPTLGMVDAIKVASHCSATVMVARLDRIESPELTEAAAILSQIKVLGVIANSSSEVRQRTNEQHLLPADN